MNWQVHSGCRSIRNDPDFIGKEINIVGISQGGLISRGIIEKCEGLDVHTYFTFGSPQAGISSYQLCRNWYCWPINWFMGYMDQYRLVQWFGAPTEYYRPWWNLDRYYNSSQYLPYINNELDYQESYRVNMQQLTNFGLWKWTEDAVVHPRESEWFYQYGPRRNLEDVYDTKFFKDDLFGLKTLHTAGKLYFYSGPGNHMHLTDAMIDDYLVPLLTGVNPAPTEH